MSKYLTDHPLFDPDSDALFFSDFRPALKEILTTSETPLTVGVFGPWGSGKTSLMRMLHQEIEAGKNPFVRTSWFTAWKYDRHDVLWRAFILRVIHALYPRETGEGNREDLEILSEDKRTPAQQEQVELLQQLEESVYQSVEWQEIGPRSYKWWQLLANASKAGGEIAATVGTGGAYLVLKKILGGGDESLLPIEEIEKAAAAVSKELKTQERKQLLHTEQFEATFQQAVAKLPGDGAGRLIVFVDDLDRCLPEKAIEVLEAIKLFLEVPGTVFVLGMDREIVHKGIEARYGSYFRRQPDDRSELPIRGDTYLQKIIQIPFHLPALSTEYLAEFITKLDPNLSDVTREVFARGLFPIPRQIKRAQNIFRLLQQIALAREARGGLPKESIAWPLLAKTVVIQTQYPDLYQLWRQYPTLLKTLEEEYARRPSQEEELIRGRRQQPDVHGEPSEGGISPEESTEPAGGLLAPYAGERQKYPLLERLLLFPDVTYEGDGRERALFAGLSRSELAVYVRLAGAVETEPELQVAESVSGDLGDLLSDDRVRVQEALARLVEEHPEPDAPERTRAKDSLYRRMVDVSLEPTARAIAGEALDALGWLPEDLNAWIRCPGCAHDGRDLLAMKYPVTNAHFEQFIEAGGYEESAYWGGEDSPGWRWRVADHNTEWRGEGPVTEPEYWRDPRFGRARRGYPVVGISWYEANAYARWLTRLLTSLHEGQDLPEERGALVADVLATGAVEVRLPTDSEWTCLAGGEEGDRYPWNGPNQATGKPEAIVQRANIYESGIRQTTPVAMYPHGADHRHGLMDLAGNVWEWTNTWHDEGKTRRLLRGGSWDVYPQGARVSVRGGSYPGSSNYLRGFRLVSPIRSGS